MEREVQYSVMSQHAPSHCHCRHLWDGDLIKCRVVSRIDENTEVFQYVTQAPPPLANRDVCILRYPVGHVNIMLMTSLHCRAWRQCRENCFAVVSTSVSHPAATLMGSIRATVLAMRFLIEPVGPNASRLTVLNRLDIRFDFHGFINIFDPYFWGIPIVIIATNR